MYVTANHSLDDLQRNQWLKFLQDVHPDIDPRAVRLMDEMRLVAHTLYQVGEQSLVNTGLSYAQYRILIGLLFYEWAGNGSGLNPSEISAYQGTSRNTISALLRSLEDEGLVERNLDRHDRRRFNIRLTALGRRKVQDHASHHMHIVDQIFSILDEEEQQALSKLLLILNQRAQDIKEHTLHSGLEGYHASSR
jgi:DNA-binding MarR family transcriptional regulator